MAAAGSTQFLVGLHDFMARSDDEITVLKGDRVEIVETDQEYGDGWYIGKNVRTGRSGLFPKVFTSELVSKKPTSSSRNGSVSGTPQSPVGMSVHETISDIDEAISEFSTAGIDSRLVHGPPGQTHSNKSAMPNLDNILSWTPQDVRQYFDARGYEPSIGDRFLHHKITGSILLELDLSYLKEIDIASFGTRFEISKDIKYLSSHVSGNQQAHTGPTLTKSRTNSSSSPSGSSKPSLGPIHSSSPSSMSSSPMAKSSQPATPQMPHDMALPKQVKKLSSGPSPLANAVSPRSSSLRSESVDPEPQTQQYARRSSNHSVGRPWAANGKSTHVTEGAWPPAETSQESLRSADGPQSAFPGSAPRSAGVSSFDSPISSTNSVDGNYINSEPSIGVGLGGTDEDNVHRSSRFGHSRITSADTVRTQNSSFYGLSKHARSTSSVIVSDSLDVLSSEDARKSHRRHSSIMSVLNNPPRQWSTGGPIEGPIAQKFSTKTPQTPIVLNDGKLDLKVGRDALAAGGKRISTEPAQRSQQQQSPSKSKVLRAASSQHNLRRPTLSKQKTSAFLEGIRTVSPEDSAKSANFSGWMHKRGGIGVGTWKNRYFTLHGTRLSYFTDLSDTKERGLIDITAHKVLPARKDEDKLISLYAASMGAGRHCFKLVPPAKGSRKGVTFTAPKVHYFAVDTKEEMREWMAALMKATIERDESVEVISSFSSPTVPLPRARELFAEARARDEDLRARMIAGGLANHKAANAGRPLGNGSAGSNGGSYDTFLAAPDSPTGSSTQSTQTGSSTNSVSKAAVYGDFHNELRHLTTKTAGLKIVTDLEDQP